MRSIPTVACRVTSGVWVSRYDGARIEQPSDLDIDHVVPLAEAWDSGAWGWDAARREAFANDLDDPRVLIAVTAATNRSKGADDPPEWMPPDANDTCRYAATWVVVKFRWQLSVDQREQTFLSDLLEGSCEGATVAIGAVDEMTPVAREPATSGATPTPVREPTATPTPMPTSTPVPEPTHTAAPGPTASGDDVDALARWDDNGNGRISCAEARAHGLAPVRRGHPAYQYMSDRDSDGVVCEE